MRNKQPVCVSTVVLLALAALGCQENRHLGASEEKAKSELHEMGKKAQQDAHRLSDDLSRGLNGRPEMSAAGAERKLANAGTRVEEAARVAQIKAKLVTDLGLSAATNIRVEDRSGLVTLEGSVETAEQKRGAVSSAQSIDGVTRVVNHLTVEQRSR